MAFLSTLRNMVMVVLALTAAGCGSGIGGSEQVPVSPTAPSPGGTGGGALSAPVPVSPVDNQQLSTLRPTLTVQNVASSGSGARTYEFQISDRVDFSLGASLTGASFLVAVNQSGVTEGSGGRTSFVVEQDLQPTTRMYWRARVVQGSSTSPWSDPASFRTKLVGYNRGGELYDPLIHGETIGQVVGSVNWIEGKGIQLNTQSSYVIYQLPQTLTSGEFSVIVEGLAPGAAGSKFKIFSMADNTGNLINNRFMANVQYRGAIDGNPDNSISFKTLYGSFSDSRKFEPDRANRLPRMLDPNRGYFWKWTWGPEVRLVVQEGLNGPTIYNYGLPTAGSYSPSPHYAFLGANTSGSVEEGSRPGAIIRHVWVGSGPRPDSLGSALE